VSSDREHSVNYVLSAGYRADGAVGAEQGVGRGRRRVRGPSHRKLSARPWQRERASTALEVINVLRSVAEQCPAQGAKKIDLVSGLRYRSPHLVNGQ